MLQLLGFSSRSVGRLRYLHRPDRRGGGATSAPLVFLHGIGGLLPYLLLLLQLSSRWAGPVLLPLLPHGAPPPATPGAEAAPSHSSASASQALSTGFQPPAASRGRCGCPSSSAPSR